MGSSANWPTTSSCPPDPHRLRWWPWALLVAVLLAGVRAAGLWGGKAWAPLLPLGFVGMTLLPWWWLDAGQRAEMGWQRAQGRWVYLKAAALGLGLSLAVFLVFLAAFGLGPDHAYVTVAETFRRQVPAGLGLPVLFVMFTLPAMLFSPVGEEVFFRGLLPWTLSARFGQRWATALECAMFGTVHLLHHGLIFHAATGELTLRPLSGGLWVICMMGVAWMFSRVRQRSGSLFPAMLCHAAFNLGMAACLFLEVWPRLPK